MVQAKITDRRYAELVEEIIKDKQKLLSKRNLPFIGISGEELHNEIKKRLETGDYVVVDEKPVKFTKADINAVASARYFRKVGITLVMALLLVVLAGAIGVKYLPANPLYYSLYYVFCGAVALGFLWIYSRGQRKIRRELWKQLGREESLEK